MDAPQENRRGNASAAPSLLGPAAATAPKGDELKILSALSATPGHGARTSARRPVALAALGIAALAIGVVGWQYATTASNEPLATAASHATALPPAPLAKAPAAEAPASANTQVVASTELPAASAALIETLPAATEPAASSASPLAVLAAAEPAVAALPVAVPAGKPAKADKAGPKKAKRSQPRAGTHIATAKSSKKKAPAHETAEEADVDLLEAMVAHVRGKNAAAANKAVPGETARR